MECDIVDNKPFLDYEGQINKLISKELEIKDKDKMTCLVCLSHVNIYYQRKISVN